MVKVEYCQSVDVEGEVEITMDEIAAAIQEELDRKIEDFDVSPVHVKTENLASYKRSCVLRVANLAFKCLNAITPAMIEFVSDEHKKITREAFSTTLERWK